jgi:hypothetical protein
LFGKCGYELHTLNYPVNGLITNEWKIDGKSYIDKNAN